MITLKQLKWSNAFSYGANNTIDFTKSQLTQLLGKNGHGKSSVALILEEVLYNKNSKGIKKGDILNRNIKDKFYTIELTFDKDGDEYVIDTKRGATQSVKLLKNGEDISSHTSTNTYKQIEELIGFDHKTFTQIVYQSHASSLEFLTSPDTARKKFLIEILNLSKYVQAGEVFKAASQDLSKAVANAEGKVDTIVQWIDKYKNVDTNPKPLQAVPELPDSGDLIDLTVAIQNIEETNKKITQNNTYKSLESKAKGGIVYAPEPQETDETQYITKMASAAKEYSAAEAFVKKMSALKGTCPTCLSPIDEHKVSSLVAERKAEMDSAAKEESAASDKLAAIKSAKALWQKAVKTSEEWEKYHALVDESVPEDLLSADDLNTKIKDIRIKIANAKAAIAVIEAENTKAAAHNSKIAVIEGQRKEMQGELQEWQSKLGDLSTKLGHINTLVKTFSTTGLVAYKIENLVKDLESISNEYLGELSGGRFQISFKITGSDKLNVVITDNGTDIDIAALSGGEKARVNVATLLAIRKLMQSLSQARINLLILDETAEALDIEGKEKLIEVLLNEESLNTILVSHGFSHPLLEKVHVSKHNGISRIEE